jgi:acyl-CoA reductase-like NAD-dependent aldehyde dehydrogenase
MPTTVTDATRAASDFLGRGVHEPFIDGAPRAGGGAVRDNHAPASGERTSRVRESSVGDCEVAVASAKRAFRDWSRTPPAERSLILLRCADRVEADAEVLARLETLDTGKPIRESRGDVRRAVDGLRFYAGLARQVRGETISVEAGLNVWTLRRPIGVVAAIVPWNVPLVLTVCKAAPALAAGNTVVVKPAEITPLTALRLAELVVDAGLPPGALNVLPGRGSVIGNALTVDPDVAKVTFTGSTETGITIAKAAAPSLKSVAMELGGKSPHIVFADADLDRAAEAVASGIFYGQGEICTAGSRMLVQRDVYDEVLERAAAHADRLVIGDPLDDRTELGSLISPEHLRSVTGAVERGVAEGATVVHGGARCEDPGLASGSFMEPTILSGQEPGSFVEQQEIFGPVVVASAFDSEEEALGRANNSRYGLSAGVWTANSARARRFAEELEAGVVWINTYNRFDAAVPLGGVKWSGNALEWSHLAMDFFTRVKSVWEQA